MSTSFSLPKKMMEQLAADHGSDPRTWNQELRDLFDPRIEARVIAPPLSGRVEKFINTDYHYHWAGPDRGGAEPNHERVESMKYAGWEFATTDDVQMCSEVTVVGRSKDKKSKDGKGFSDEIRCGDMRLMKLPMALWRQKRKAENMAAYQMAYPQPYDQAGKPMTAGKLIPGLNSRLLEGAEIDEAHRKAVQQKENPAI